MKKIVITLALILPLFLINNVQAQSNPNLPNFDVFVYVNAPSQCPASGTVTGYVDPLDYTYTSYSGPRVEGEQPYHLLWDGNFPGTEDVFVSVKTTTNSSGTYCYDDQTKSVSGNNYGEDFHLNLVTMTSAGGGDDPD